jgi:hypothetical protein
MVEMLAAVPSPLILAVALLLSFIGPFAFPDLISLIDLSFQYFPFEHHNLHMVQ